jgi:hypothetical protein
MAARREKRPTLKNTAIVIYNRKENGSMGTLFLNKSDFFKNAARRVAAWPLPSPLFCRRAPF